jgi:transposase-like protein
MQETASIQCPFCGQYCEVELDASIASQRFTTDCEVCCRPFSVHAECELGEVISAEATGE